MICGLPWIFLENSKRHKCGMLQGLSLKPLPDLLTVVIPHHDKVSPSAPSAIMQLHVSVARVFAPPAVVPHGQDGQLETFFSSD